MPKGINKLTKITLTLLIRYNAGLAQVIEPISNINNP